MKKHQALARLQQLIEPELLALERNIIIPDGAGFIVFGCYRIDPQSGHYHVSKHGDDRGEFSAGASFGPVTFCADRPRIRLDSRKLSKADPTGFAIRAPPGV